MFISKDSDRLMRQFKALADPLRLRLIALCRHGELSVSELTLVLDQSQPRVSQQLKQLCECGLLQRFRDGKRVYYRLNTSTTTTERRLLDLVPATDPQFLEDAGRLRRLRGRDIEELPADLSQDIARRAIHRALLDQTVAAPIGDLLDIGCGRGAILKLLASRANRAIGVDIDADARSVARAELLLAGLANCSLRKGDMYRLPFENGEFDTIVLDDVLSDAERPEQVLREARRLLRDGGRLFILLDLRSPNAAEARNQVAAWSAAAGLRIGSPRFVPRTESSWMLSIATLASASHDNSEAA